MLELLNQLDGFESTKNIKVIMATNRIGGHRSGVLSFDLGLTSITCTDILDSALLRPGRIDRKIEFPHLVPRRVWQFSGSILARFVPGFGAIVCVNGPPFLQMSLQRGINLRALAEEDGPVFGG
jgi:hypothetical protein